MARQPRRTTKSSTQFLVEILRKIYPRYPQNLQTNISGTRYPVWLSGTLPEKSDSESIMKANVACNEKICQPWNVRVRKCREGRNNHFFVYELPSVPRCPMAYCAGKRIYSIRAKNAERLGVKKNIRSNKLRLKSACFHQTFSYFRNCLLVKK